MYDLDGETAIVTGAAQGFGRGIAELLGEAGANVVLADVQVEKAEEVADGIREDGSAAEVVECDVTDVGQTDAFRGTRPRAVRHRRGARQQRGRRQGRDVHRPEPRGVAAGGVVQPPRHVQLLVLGGSGDG